MTNETTTRIRLIHLNTYEVNHPYEAAVSVARAIRESGAKARIVCQSAHHSYDVVTGDRFVRFVATRFRVANEGDILRAAAAKATEVRP